MSLPQAILSLDFAALRTFRLVYQKSSFSAAADELGMNTSSVSYTIERVRRAAGDPLFVRQGGGIVPTDNCRRLIGSVERILAEAEQISPQGAFDPSTAEGEVTVYSVTYPNEVIWPQVLRRLQQEAPGVRLSIIAGFQGYREPLLKGDIDIATTVGSIEVSGVRVIENFLPDEHVCIMDPRHPLARKSVLTVEDFVSFGHVRFEPSPGWMQTPIRYAVEQGFSPKRIFASYHSLDAARIVVGTDLLATLPSRLAWPRRDWLGIAPFDFPTPIRSKMIWTEATYRSPLKSWVRGLLLEEEAKLPAIQF